MIPSARIRPLNDAPARADGRYVLYWMVAQRRTRSNFALQRAVERATELRRPLLVLEALRCDYPWACARFHRFVIDGMADQAPALDRARVRYYPYVEPRPGAGRGLLAALAGEACLVVTDDFPAFMLPRLVAAGARRCDVLVEAVDSNGILPLAVADRAFPTAYAFRRFLQRELREHLAGFPEPDPLARIDLPRLARLPSGIARRWPAVPAARLAAPARMVQALPLDPSVGPTGSTGGARAAQAALGAFLGRVERYDEERNRLDADVTSGLSPYLHFGHIASHDVCRGVLEREGWTIDRLGDDASGKRAGWWGLGPSAEAFLDQLVTWRELGYNMCRQREDYDRFDTLPDWAVRTLQDHAEDAREHTYTLEQFDEAATHDPLWNAAQRQLRREGRIHNYLRMLWGKKILHWSANPQDALDVMIELNNKYALDGRNPNSYSGIFWVLGRYDRPWGPERAVFGKVRYMSSRNTARKLNTAPYLERYGEG